MSRRRLLVLSHVHPYLRRSGQQQRVFYTLRAARERFHVTFATVASPSARAEVEAGMDDLCDELVCWPSRYSRSTPSRLFHRAASLVYAGATGLKRSNYTVGVLELAPDRVASLVDGGYDLVLYEYFHAAGSADLFRERGVPCVLDMHNVLWLSYQRHLAGRRIPPPVRSWMVHRYRGREEQAWRRFDGLIAINREEERMVSDRVREDVPVFYGPMGIDLSGWPYAWAPASPPRIGYYGGLGTRRNQEAAFQVYRDVMPAVWRVAPEAELWIVGSHPPAEVRALADDPRVRVTGFVEDVAEVLATLSVVVVPWRGTFGFRSRLVEVMALGVPLVTTPDAVWGMELEHERGLLLSGRDDEMASAVVGLLEDAAARRRLSRQAREVVERRYSLHATYGRLLEELDAWIQERSTSVA